MTIARDRKADEGRSLEARATDREIFIDLEHVTHLTTCIRGTVEMEDIFLKDRATASEIMVQAATTLDNRVAEQ
ncbi:MAG TPA: hypothetical protein VGC25_11345 [Alphaproteobacteria bacterium]|jgi:hypothetical protein